MSLSRDSIEELQRELNAAIELLMHVLYQARGRREGGEYLIEHWSMSTYEHATAWLEERGYLEETDRMGSYRVVRWPGEDGEA